MRKAAFAAALALASVALASTARAQHVAVIVNGEPVTTFDIEQRAKLIKLTNHRDAPRQEVIDDLINEKLKVQIGKRYKLDMTEPEIDGAYVEMAKRMRLTGPQLTQTLTTQGVQPYTLKDRIRAETVWQQIVRGKYAGSFQQSEKEIAAALEARKKDDKEVIGFEYTLQPILFVIARGSGEEVTSIKKRDAESLRARFDGCQTGLALARGLRDVAVREPITKTSADLAPALRDILDKTPVGKLTEPEVTAQGVELFAVCNKRETRLGSAAKREVQNEMFSEQFASNSKKLLESLRKQAMIEYKEVPDAAPAARSKSR
jgi:peptidyl-prolyl cis-trans isomerase SurA